MTAEEAIAKLEADYEASANQGPWQIYPTDAPGQRPGIEAEDESVIVWGDGTDRDDQDMAGVQHAEDAAHIVSIHNATPALLAGMRALVGLLDYFFDDPEMTAGGSSLVEVARDAVAALGETVTE